MDEILQDVEFAVGPHYLIVWNYTFTKGGTDKTYGGLESLTATILTFVFPMREVYHYHGC